MAQVKFYTCTYSVFESTSPKNPNALYFVTDKLQLYKGDQCYTSNFKVVSNPPAAGEATPGILYISRNTHQLFIAGDGGSVEALTPPIKDVVEKGSTDLVTSGGVYSAIEAVIKVADELDKTVKDHSEKISEIQEMLGIDPDNPPDEGEDPENPDNPDNPTPPKKSVIDRLDDLDKKVSDLEESGGGTGSGSSGLSDRVSNLEQNAILKGESGVVSGIIKVSGTPTEDNDVATKKYVDDKVTEVTEVIGGIDEDTLDIIQQVTEWANDPDGLAQSIANDIADLKQDTVKKEEGKGLSSNDFTDDYKSKLDSLTTNPDGSITVGGAIDKIKVNGDALPIAADKSVEITIATGTGNGYINVNGKQVKVSGLKSAAYKEATEFATAEQGSKADSALQQSDITASDKYGSIKVGDKEITIPGLGTAAFKDATEFVAASKLGDLGSYSTISEYASALSTKAKTDAVTEAQQIIDEALAWDTLS